MSTVLRTPDLFLVIVVFFFFSLDSNFDLLFRLSEGYLRRTESVAELTMEEEKD